MPYAQHLSFQLACMMYLSFLFLFISHRPSQRPIRQKKQNCLWNNICQNVLPTVGKQVRFAPKNFFFLRKTKTNNNNNNNNNL